MGLFRLRCPYGCGADRGYCRCRKGGATKHARVEKRPMSKGCKGNGLTKWGVSRF